MTSLIDINPANNNGPLAFSSDLIEYYRLQLKEEKDRRTYYQTIAYDVCNIIDRYRIDGKKTICGTVAEPSYDVVDSLSDILEPRDNLP